VAADDGGVCPQGCPFFDEGRAYLVHFGDFGAGVVRTLLDIAPPPQLQNKRDSSN
jgi:hypothetical protein